jgi:hypothetical protein
MTSASAYIGELPCTGGAADAEGDAAGFVAQALEVADGECDEVRRHRGVVAKRTVCLPADGPGVSESCAPLEIAMWPSSTVAAIANVAFSSGSSNDGNASRASVACICVEAYFFPFTSPR